MATGTSWFGACRSLARHVSSAAERSAVSRLAAWPRSSPRSGCPSCQPAAAAVASWTGRMFSSCRRPRSSRGTIPRSPVGRVPSGGRRRPDRGSQSTAAASSTHWSRSLSLSAQSTCFVTVLGSFFLGSRIKKACRYWLSLSSEPGAGEAFSLGCDCLPIWAFCSLMVPRCAPLGAS